MIDDDPIRWTEKDRYGHEIYLSQEHERTDCKL